MAKQTDSSIHAVWVHYEILRRAVAFGFYAPAGPQDSLSGSMAPSHFALLHMRVDLVDHVSFPSSSSCSASDCYGPTVRMPIIDRNCMSGLSHAAALDVRSVLDAALGALQSVHLTVVDARRESQIQPRMIFRRQSESG
ncbi:hypothetical protein BST61_g4699 [Cercospora zeina]